jgi:peptidoglycan/xylan/chitin deacetylase (PgdA/CDA1 family)
MRSESVSSAGIVCLTFDFDTMPSWINSFGATALGILPSGEFGGRVGISRVLNLLERYSILATFCVPGYTAERFPEAVQAIVAQGHEIGHHWYLQESPIQFLGDPLREGAMYERGIEALDRVAGIRPVGY